MKSRPLHSDRRACPPSATSSRNEGSDDVPLPIGSTHSKDDTVMAEISGSGSSILTSETITSSRIAAVVQMVQGFHNVVTPREARAPWSLQADSSRWQFSCRQRKP
ncbi:MAG: hypothetical protein M0041_00065 [Nitrospiraceae bacterium]|nr:hypothetical protein [Nitrospiraceae bacterium]